MIRRAKLSEIGEIVSITQACGAKMASEGIFQWYDFYPNKAIFEEDISREELFVLIIDEKIVGCVVISSVKDTVYNEVTWLAEDGRNFYIHRLAIHPEFQNRGYAKKLMDFAEALALQKNVDSIRLDTFSQNLRNQKFYEARGYIRLGDIFFPDQSEHPFYCYELIINH
jgi:ribosomal protein S18 acetylase RimI-like enzyme